MTLTTGSNPIRIGIVGCGRILPAHLRGYRRLREAGYDDFRITALVARKRDDALMFRQRGEGPAPRPPVSQNPDDALGAPHSYVSDFQPELLPDVYTDVGEMLASGTVDAVDLTASLPVHHTIGLQCLATGKHLMVEKPLAITVKAGAQMVEAAEAAGLALGVMENVRFQESVRLARWAIERGELGNLQMIAAISLGTGEWSPDRVVADTPWRHNRLEAGGGASIDIGVHLAHRLRYLAGEVRSMTAIARVFELRRELRDDKGHVSGQFPADADDAFFALPEFENGAAGTISFTWAGHGEPTGLPEGTAIYGERGCLKGSTLIRDGGERIDLRDLFAAEASLETRDAYFPRGLTDTFALAYRDWLDAIAAQHQPEMNGREGLHDLATAFAIMESATAHRSVAVADVLTGKVDAYQREIDRHYGL
ncbi:MAG TPA: Gfo/Idh/MocA family oxidoreductase [Nitrolancea sp.]|nr:Gfo/Idh/MocA family oxidoreductase [Nitrolancea sp.]